MMPQSLKPVKIFVIAGEPSGDLLGARLMHSLKTISENQNIGLEWYGVGGQRMVEEGLSSLFPMSDLTLFGLAELLPKIPLILKRIQQTAHAIQHTKPDVVITIDAPDFCFRVAKKLQGCNIPFIHYVAPTVWAWRPNRAKKIQPLFKHLLTLFPFEPPYFERVGLSASFVGHPLVEADIDRASGERFRAKFNLSPDQPILVVLPGSRRSELNYLLNDFEKAVALLIKEHPTLKVVIPTIFHHYDRLVKATKSWKTPPLVITGDEDKYDAFKAASAALAASGTVALELALAHTPTVVAYKVHPITAALYRRLIKTKYVNLVNIMVDDCVIPELLQENCTPECLAHEVNTLLCDPIAREKQVKVLQSVRGWLSPQGSALKPSEEAAHVVLKTLSHHHD